jgi:microsomal dipeptidase-like Zn-dependent dipeptidase
MPRLHLQRGRWLLALLCVHTLAAAQVPAKPPAEPVSNAARALHEQLLTLDTHLDTPANLAVLGWSIGDRHDANRDGSQVDLPRLVQGGLDGGFWAIYTPQGPRTPAGDRAARDFALTRALAIREMVAANPKSFELALRADDATAIAARHKRVVFLSIENAYPLEADLSLLETFYKLGVRLSGLAHFSNNDLADSATDPKGPEWQGLSEKGRAFVAEANRLGIVLDASHASDQVLVARKHEIERRWPVPRATFEDAIAHLLHAIQVAGIDHVGIGADLDGGGGVSGFEDSRDYPRITARLLRAGYSRDDIQKVWSGNVLRVLRAAEAYAAGVAAQPAVAASGAPPPSH